MTNHKKIVVGKLGSTYGLKGHLKVNSFCMPASNMLNYSPWFVQRGSDWIELEIEESSLYRDQPLVKVIGVDTPELAKQQYTNLLVAVNRTQLPDIDRGYYWSDLEGLTVINLEGDDFGQVDHVFDTGANDVLVVAGDKKRQVPFIDKVIQSVDLEAGKITVDWGLDFGEE